MTQNASDVEIANQGFAAFRQDLNDVLEDITTLHSGNTAPTTTYANQWWYEEDTDKLYIRNEDNDAWIEILTLDQANDHLATIGATITLDGSGNASIDGTFDVNGNELILDADGDTSITADTDDRIDFRVGGTDRVHFKGSLVGIGTNDPDQTLHLSTTGTHYLRVTSTNTGVDTDFGTSATGAEIITRQSAPIRFQTNGTERARILPTGGITFNGDTAAANALDDYEEGTWTPTVAYGTISVIRSAYTKIGRAVTVTATVQRTTASSSTNTLAFTGLPFQTSTNGEWIGAAMNNGSDLQSTGIVSYMYGLNATDEILIYNNRDNASPLSMKHYEFGLNDYLYFTITYFT